MGRKPVISSPGLERSLRLIVAVIGGYAFASGLAAVIAVTLPLLGMERSESATLGGILGMPAYLIIIIWAAASTRPIRSSLIIFISAAIMTGTAPLMVPG